jgi:putative PIN family toxin of toxin-antitoxin system
VSSAVLDTNVLVSGLAWPSSTPGSLIARWQAGQFELVLSAHILEEVERTLAKPYFRSRVSARDAVRHLANLRERCRLITMVAEVIGVATHPEDDWILAAAVSADADYLVSGDIQLQRLGKFESVQILTLRAFLDLLEAEA